MNEIARLLQRATARERDGELAEVWPRGRRVRLALSGGAALPHLHGRVAFVEDGWIYWVAEDGREHASKPDVLRRIG